MSISFDSAAIIVWMAEGAEPSIEAYQVSDGEAPETVGCWSLGLALIIATRGPSRSGKRPWIKVGNLLIDPNSHERLYEDFKGGRAFAE